MKYSACPNYYETLEQLARTIPDLDREAILAFIPLLYLHRELGSALEQHFQAHGVSTGRWQVLIQLYKSDRTGLTPAELAERSGVTRAAVTGLVDSLVESGHVARGEVGEADRRTYRVQLTDRGNALVRKVLPDHMRRMQGLMHALTPDERQIFVTQVEKLRERLSVFRHDD
jgi:DNA-binding MarR family transcriptional regulator